MIGHSASIERIDPAGQLLHFLVVERARGFAQFEFGDWVLGFTQQFDSGRHGRRGFDGERGEDRQSLDRIAFRRRHSPRHWRIDGGDAADQFAILRRQQISDAAAGRFAGGDDAGTIDIVFLQHVVDRFADEFELGALPVALIDAFGSEQNQIIRFAKRLPGGD